jgi:hypothetical protein
MRELISQSSQQLVSPVATHFPVWQCALQVSPLVSICGDHSGSRT